MNTFQANEGMLVPSGFYNAQGQAMTREAFYALRAAQMVKQIGRYAARKYALKSGASLRLFYLAQQLEAINKFDKADKV